MAARIEDSWEKKGAVSLALWPLSLLYAGGWLSYQAWYGLGFKKSLRPHRRTLCVGNLVVGGVGKTPLTWHLVQVIRSLGHQVVVSTSGYGSTARKGATLAPAGELDPAEFGDETALLRWKDPSLPLIAGKSRVAAAQIAAREFPDHVMVMDDGFQHLPLSPHISLVLDPDRANTFCLPAGPYREPRSTGRRRAQMVLPGRFTWTATQTPLVNPDGEGVPSPPQVQLLCALGQPGKVQAGLESMGSWVAHKVFLPDHDPLSAGTLFETFDPSLPLVVTSKDWMKIRRRSDWQRFTILIADYEMKICPEADFRAWLGSELDGL